jgi:hypothetical protein
VQRGGGQRLLLPRLQKVFAGQAQQGGCAEATDRSRGRPARAGSRSAPDLVPPPRACASSLFALASQPPPRAEILIRLMPAALRRVRMRSRGSCACFKGRGSAQFSRFWCWGPRAAAHLLHVLLPCHVQCC